MQRDVLLYHSFRPTCPRLASPLHLWSEPRGSMELPCCGNEGQEVSMDSQVDMSIERKDASRQIGQAAARERHKNERLAKQLSGEAMQQWQRSIEGLLA